MNWQEAIDRTVAGLGYDLVDTERAPRGLLRVYIDKLPASRAGAAAPVDPVAEFINVDDCERVTRQLQHVLEVEGCPYERLEVSSPGLDRPLKKPADYERFVGERISLTLKMPFQGRKKYEGVLAAVEGGWRIVFMAGAGKDAAEHALDFSLEEVREARLVPVLDFKGRRFAAPQATPADDGGAAAEASDIETDGDRKP